MLKLFCLAPSLFFKERSWGPPLSLLRSRRVGDRPTISANLMSNLDLVTW